MMKCVIPFSFQMDWTCNIGESAIDIVIFSSSNAPLSIFVLGEAYELCITINLKGIGSRHPTDEQL